MFSRLHLVTLVVLMITVIFSFAEEKQTATIIVHFNNIEHDNGVIKAMLMNTDSRDSFPSPGANGPVQRQITGIENQLASVTFSNLPYGSYAISSYHDENANDKLDSNFMGMPKEGFGFSNNPKMTFGPPKFDNAKFELKTDTLQVNIQLRY